MNHERQLRTLMTLLLVLTVLLTAGSLTADAATGLPKPAQREYSVDAAQDAPGDMRAEDDTDFIDRYFDTIPMRMLLFFLAIGGILLISILFYKILDIIDDSLGGGDGSLHRTNDSNRPSDRSGGGSSGGGSYGGGSSGGGGASGRW